MVFAAFAFLVAPGVRADEIGSNFSNFFTPAPATGWAPPAQLEISSPLRPENWRIGAYVGQFNHGQEIELFAWPPSAIGAFGPFYSFGANAVYTAARLPKIPLEVEVDLAAIAHSGSQSYSEFNIVPTLRWTWFPWNEYLFTTVRFGPLGISMASASPEVDTMYATRKHTRQILNGAVEEWTFSPSRVSDWEAFLRVDHRSGIFGLIDGVDTGSNFVAVGARMRL